jgi:hypothetical protein
MKLRDTLGTLLLAALVASPALALAQGYGPNSYYGNGYYDRGAQRQLSGIIQSVQGSSFTLDDGRTVFLRQGTVINPTGWRLRPGMRVNVTGFRAGNGAINANEVDIVRRRDRM